MRRENNIFIGDYEKQLDDAGISPEDELHDVMEEIADRSGEFYDILRARLQAILDNYDTREPIKEGRKKIDFRPYILKTACMSAEYMFKTEKGYPIEATELGNGSYTQRRVYPPEVEEELELVFWCYHEMEMVHYRLRNIYEE